LAEDAVQDAFLNVLRGLKDFEGRSDLKTWLHRITVYASLTKLRHVDRLKEQEIEAHLPDFDHNDCRVEAPWPYLATLEDVVATEKLRGVVIGSYCSSAISRDTTPVRWRAYASCRRPTSKCGCTGRGQR
jgi:hypothetical protein